MSSVLDKQYSRLIESPEAAQVHSALENELYLHAAEGNKKLLVASVQPGEGKMSIVLLCALYGATVRPNERILLVDAELGEKQLPAFLEARVPSEGATKNLLGPVVQLTRFDNVDYVNVVRKEGNGVDGDVQISHKKVEEFLDSVESDYQLIVINPPPLSKSKNLLALSAMADQAIIVLKQRSATREQLRVLVSELKRYETPVMGAIITGRKYHVPRWLYK